MKRALATLLFVAACQGPGPTPIDTDDVEETDVRGDTFVLNPGDTVPDTDDDSGFLDSDSALGGDDTAGCKLGFLEDCDGNCFPDHFVGDGFCDDGSTLPANFDCDAWSHDQGDCADGDTDTGGAPECGRFTLEFHPTIYANEIGWYIDRLENGVITQHEIYKVAPGTYASTKVYVHDLYLPPGDYQLVGQDIPYGDGWHGGYFYLIDEVTGQALLYGGPEMLGYRSSFVWNFTVTCDTPKCEVDVSTLAGDDVAESGWQLFTGAARAVAEMLPGTLGSGTTTRRLELYQGPYVLRLRDLAGDGWEGGQSEVRYPAGLLLTARGIGTGADAAATFEVDCGTASTLPASDAPRTITPSSCTGVKVNFFQRGTDYDDVGWELWNTEAWTRVDGRPTGSYTMTSNFVNTVNLVSGRYFFQALDNGKDGWEDARISLDGPNGEMLTTFVMPYGANAGFYVDVVCPDDVVDTDVDTDEPAPTCEPGATFDCRGVCFPAVLKGDGFCDDGQLWSADFACAEHAFDDGDCNAPPDSGTVR